jgi:GNAT superfamily N-acetyltransferase
VRIEILEGATGETVAVRDALLACNAKVVGPSGYRPLELLLRAPDGGVAGGLGGSTYWQWLVIESLWVHPSHRRHGYGRWLLSEAEAQGRARGCLSACLETYTFQDGRRLYESAGYQVYATLPGFPPGHARLFLMKQL